MGVAEVGVIDLVSSRGITNITPLPKGKVRRRVARFFLRDEDNVLSVSNSKGYSGIGYWIEIFNPNGNGHSNKRVRNYHRFLKLRRWKSRNGTEPQPGVLQIKVLDQEENDDDSKRPKWRPGRYIIYLGSVIGEDNEKYYVYAVFHKTSPN